MLRNLLTNLLTSFEHLGIVPLYLSVFVLWLAIGVILPWYCCGRLIFWAARKALGPKQFDRVEWSLMMLIIFGGFLVEVTFWSTVSETLYP